MKPHTLLCTVGTSLLGHAKNSAAPDQMKQALIKYGPIVAYIAAGSLDFQNYAGGIYSNPACDDTGLDHVVMITGFGVSSSGQPYWIIKNSWGKTWGEVSESMQMLSCYFNNYNFITCLSMDT